MGRAQGKDHGAAGPRHEAAFPPTLNRVLPDDTKKAWRELVPLLPLELYLAGGTAVAAHLGHRSSRDLDLFYHHDAVDLQALKCALEATGEFVVLQESSGTLKGLYGETKLEILHADETDVQTPIEPAEVVSGLRIAGMRDLAAMKARTIGDRGEMRDYFDLKAIEEQEGVTVEQALQLYAQRWGVAMTHISIRHIIEALGYLDDVDEDKSLPISKADLEKWWKIRQVRLIRHLRY